MTRQQNNANRLKKLSAEHLRAVRMRVNGVKTGEIAKQLGRNPVTIRRWFATEPLIQEEVNRVMTKIREKTDQTVEEWWEDTAVERRNLVSDAYDTLKEIMADKQTSAVARVSAARLVIATCTPAPVSADEGGDNVVELRQVMESIDNKLG